MYLFIFTNWFPAGFQVEVIIFIPLLLPIYALRSVSQWGCYPRGDDLSSGLTRRQRLTKEVNHKSVVVTVNVCGGIGLKLDGYISHGRVELKA